MTIPAGVRHITASRRIKLLSLAALACLVLTLALYRHLGIIPVAHATSPNIVISQVYGGGGNSGSTYTNDFIELYNRGTSTVDITGWSVQYSSATLTTWTATTLSGTIAPGHYYLVQEAQGAGGTTALPTPDATGTVNLSATNGKIALSSTATAFSGACPTGASLVDLVGYGTANCAEGSATSTLSNTAAAIRKSGGCQDTDSNSGDFIVSGPIPRNSSASVNSCGGDPAQLSGVGNSNPTSVDPSSNTLLTVTVTPASNPPSTGITVTGNLTSIGGSANQQFYDDGTHGDATAGDNIFSFLATVGANTATGAKNIPVTISDAQARTAQAGITVSVQSPTCGVERWSVKTGTDPDANQVNLSTPTPVTISVMRSWPAPATPPDNARVVPYETTLWVVNATMTLYKKETDVDYHIVIQDRAGQTIVTEIPCPCCIGPTSPFFLRDSIARQDFDARLTATTSFQSASIPVRIKGVGFFDLIHGQTGVAPNGIELHPILGITFYPAVVSLSNFDGDSKADVATWNQNNGNWTIINSSNGSSRVQLDWGRASLGDIAVPGDYDGDNKTDIAVYRPSEGNWYIIQSSTGTIRLVNWGTGTDVPVPGDYDGDGKTDVAVYRPTEGNWYVVNSSTNTAMVRGWGNASDKPVPADYDGDGRTDITVYRPNEGNWYILNSSDGSIRLTNWGASNDKLVPADYDGDGRVDLAVYRPSEGNWYILNSATNTVTVRGWGLGGDRPVPADYDGDGRADIAVWRPADGNWYIIQSGTGSIKLTNLGSSGDVPVPSAYLPQ
jgi:hypothetical protein